MSKWAFLNFSQGKMDDAIKEWNAALELNPKDYLALYYKGLSAIQINAAMPASAAQFKKTLDDVLAIQPNFTLAYVMRSRMLVEMGDLDGAAASARKAINLEPDLAGYFLNYAEIELLQKKYAAALRNAQFVARLWDDADRGEALDLIIRIRAASKFQPTGDEKKEEDDLMQGFAKGTIPIRGEIESVSCSNNRLNSVTVKAEGKEYSFRLKQGSFGFSDTIGITGEHFNVCYHANGYPDRRTRQRTSRSWVPYQKCLASRSATSCCREKLNSLPHEKKPPIPSAAFEAESRDAIPSRSHSRR